MFETMVKEIKSREKNYIPSAAIKAQKRLCEILMTVPKDSKEYEKEFEDDVFAIIKDIFNNAVKWGKEMSGKELPEGAFGLSYRKKNDERNKSFNFSFSYDCKYNSNQKGYELDIGEKRKAVKYVKALNQTDYVTSFDDHKKLTGHIFISNKFVTGQLKGMKEHFDENLFGDYKAKPIFVNVDVLIHLHQLYREHLRYILHSPNLFYEKLHLAFMSSDDGIVTIADIKRVFKKVLDPSLAETDSLDTVGLTEDLLYQI